MSWRRDKNKFRVNSMDWFITQTRGRMLRLPDKVIAKPIVEASALRGDLGYQTTAVHRREAFCYRARR